LRSCSSGKGSAGQRVLHLCAVQLQIHYQHHQHACSTGSLCVQDTPPCPCLDSTCCAAVVAAKVVPVSVCCIVCCSTPHASPTPTMILQHR
jgi:hypothetical protein